MEKRKCIISKHINSYTPEIPSNRRGLDRPIHLGGIIVVNLKLLP